MRRILIAAALLIVAVMAVPAFAQTPSPASDRVDAGSIAIGDTVNGTLTFQEPALVYSLNAEAGQAVNIALISDAFDAYLTVEDSSGNVVSYNDDSNGERNSRISNLVLSSGGTYKIIAESYGHNVGSGTQEGDFTLSVTEAVVQHIEYTQTVNGELTNDALAQDYVFSGSAGDTVVIQEKSDAFDSYLHLMDSSGNDLMTNDDSGGTLNSQIGPYALPSTGTYTIRATSLSGTSVGAFTLSLNRVESQVINYGDSVEVEFTERARQFYFTFTGTYGDVISLTAASDGSVNTSLTVNDPYNSQVAFDDDSGAGYDPEILGTTLNSDGTFTIVLQAVDNGNGKVTVKLNRVPPKSLDEGSQTINFTSSQTQIPLVFNASAGQTYRLNISVANHAQSSSMSVSVRQNGSSISDTSSSYISGLSVEFTVQSAGSVQVVVSDYTYSNLQMTVDLTPVE